jgi:hypothetical protein
MKKDRMFLGSNGRNIEGVDFSVRIAPTNSHGFDNWMLFVDGVQVSTGISYDEIPGRIKEYLETSGIMKSITRQLGVKNEQTIES